MSVRVGLLLPVHERLLHRMRPSNQRPARHQAHFSDLTLVQAL
jgi:hypothetical protein